jgi:hypothetical protein
MRRLTHTLIALAGLAIAPAAHAASADSRFDGDSVSTELHLSKVEVLAVDGKLRSGRVVRLEPGNHFLTLVSVRPPRAGTRVRQQIPFTAEPCKHYVVAADHGEAMRDEWTLVVLRTDARPGCDPTAYTPPPPPDAKRYMGFDQELSMLGDRLAVRTLGERCGTIVGDEARGAKAIARWEAENGKAVDAVEVRAQYFVISRGAIGGYERSVQMVQLFEEGIAARREQVTAEALGQGELGERCALALAELEKRVAVYDRSLAARNAVKDARSYADKYGAQYKPMVEKNWANLVEDAEVVGGYWVKPQTTP